MSPASPTSRISGVDPWRTLEALSFYRVVACVALVVLATSDYRPPYFEGGHANLIDAVLFTYLLVAAFLLVLVRSERPGHRWQAAVQITVDIGFIVLLVYFAGGIASGLATLLVTPIAAGSLLLDRPLSAVPPALATITLLLVEIYLNLLYPEYPEQYTQTGILGGGLFIIAFSGSALARRARESEARAQRAQSDIAKLSALSESVIQKLQAGVLVCDSVGRIELMNRAARNLLGTGSTNGQQLPTCAPALWQRMRHWRMDPGALASSAIELPGHQRAWAQFTLLGQNEQASTLIVLDDASRVEEQAQSMKLASLGRLTASIAHELRNPLSAIQHAAELAGESEQLGNDDRPLIDIIRRQTARLEDVIGSVLSLSRKSVPSPECRNLKGLLAAASSDFLESCNGEQPDIRISVSPETIEIYIEPVQLAQILHNMLENARRHGVTHGQRLRVDIEARLSVDGNEVLIDLRDNGPGIPREIAAQVFEPFFSTHHQGVGLGLFITRELCAAANGDLQLISHNADTGAYFRLTFPVVPMTP